MSVVWAELSYPLFGVWGGGRCNSSQLRPGLFYSTETNVCGLRETTFEGLVLFEVAGTRG